MFDGVDTQQLGSNMLRDRLVAGKSVETRVFGFSMWPRLKDGALVRVEPCAGSDVKPGDVVLFARRDRFVLHRALRVGRSHVLLKGDACTDVDGWIPLDRIYGRMRRRHGDRSLARFAPRLGPALGLASVVARRTLGFASKF